MYHFQREHRGLEVEKLLNVVVVVVVVVVNMTLQKLANSHDRKMVVVGKGVVG